MTTRPEQRGNTFYKMLKKRRPAAASSSAVSSLKTTEGDPVSLLDHHEFDPTEVDMTETEQNECSGSSFDDDQAVIVPHSQIISTVAEEQDSAGSQNQLNNEEEHDEDDDDDNLINPEMLVTMLEEVNVPDAYSRRRRLKQPNRSLEMEDLTKILAHVNICEEANADPRWDVIHELAYGDHLQERENVKQRHAIKAESHPNEEEEEQFLEGMYSLDIRSSGSSRLAKLSADGEESSEDLKEGTSDHQPPEKTKKFYKRDSNDSSESLSLGDVIANPSSEENSSTFTLEANTHSVDSSVTWYEGADITEIIISEDELDEFLPSYNDGDDGDDDGDDDDDSFVGSDASTSPPPSEGDIMHTQPPLDSVSFGEDSLSRVYRRRQPRRYADSE